MSDEYPFVRFEASLLIGSLLFLSVGRDQFNEREGNYKIMQALIFDNELFVRESVGFLIYRFSIHKDGMKMLYDSNTIFRIVDAFNFYSKSSKVEENKFFLLYILEAFINLSMYDFGIFHMLGNGLINSFYNLFYMNK